MITFTDRLIAAFDELPEDKKNKNQLARYCGAGPSSVTDWFSGKTKIPNAKAVPRLAEYLNVSERWLLEGKGAKSRAAQSVVSDGSSDAADILQSGYIRLDYLDIESSAGDGSVVEYQPQVKQLLVLEDWARDYLKTTSPNHIKIINNRGVSMHPTIRDGDVLFVDISKSYFDGDGIYIIAVNGELRTKRLIQLTDGRLKIVSDNPAPGYEPEYIDKKNYSSLNICGKVKNYFSLMQAV